MTDKTYRWATPYEWLVWAVEQEKVTATDLLYLARKLDSDQIQDTFQEDMDADGYLEERGKSFTIPHSFKQDSHLWSRIFDAMKTMGNLSDALNYMEESLTFDEYTEIDYFFEWLRDNDLNCGHGNYWERYIAFKNEKAEIEAKEDDQDA